MNDKEKIEYELVAVRVKNFKAFTDSKWIKLNKLTFLLGANSSGKSSILQVFELLRRCYSMLKREDYFYSLDRLADKVGEFKELHNNNSQEDSIVFSFKFKSKVDDKEIVEYRIALAEKDNGEVSSIILKYGGKSIKVYPDTVPTYLPVNVFFWQIKDAIKLTNLQIGNKMRGIQSALIEFAENMTVLLPQRVNPERNMNFSGGKNISLGDDGQNVYQLLFNATMNQEKGNSRIELVNKWLNKFGYSFRFRMYKPNQGEFMLKNLTTGKETNIVDNGFGISQSLPVIVALAQHNKGMLLIDSPEAFLQTNMQAEIADYIIQGSKRGCMLLEIASEYILTRLQRRIAEGSASSEDVSLYYIYDSPFGKAYIEEVNMTEDGAFTDASEAFMNFFSSNYEDIVHWEDAKRMKLLDKNRGLL